MIDGYITHDKFAHYMDGATLVDGYFSLDSSAAITASAFHPAGCSVAKSSTGVYTVTLGVSFQKAHVFPTLVGSGTIGVGVRVGSQSATNRTFQVITVNSSGAPTDTSTACAINLLILLDKSVL